MTVVDRLVALYHRLTPVLICLCHSMALIGGFHSVVSRRITERFKEFMTLRGIFLLEVVCVKEAIRFVADLMCVAARTAPKAVGKDFVVTSVVQGDALLDLANAMVEYGKTTGKKNYDRDGANVAASSACVLIGLKDAKVCGLNCGACGHDKCVDLPELSDGPEFKGPVCTWRTIDMGIALGSAVKVASMHNVDNRIIYRVGVLAKKMGLIDADVVIGIPLSASGKNIYFDRG